MISVSGKRWVETEVNKNSLEKLKQDFKFNDILSKLILSRNYDQAEIFNINNNLEVHNEFINNSDFNEASELLINAIKKNENICILGDYDVDGSAATSLFVRFLNHIKQPNYYYIPDREKDGYGASVDIFKRLILKKPKLIIMLDCGSTSNEAIEFLNKHNIKSLIIDHHEINKPYPKSNTIINPKKNNGYINYDYFCATALTYFFLDILIKNIKSSFKISDFLVYVLLATVCDVMPLRKTNRLIAKKVIDKFHIKKNIAFKNLFKFDINKNKINVDDLGYYIGPILNSGGRLGKSMYATELLTSDNIDIVNKKSNSLIKLNDKRKKIENNILNEIDFNKIQKENKNIIIYFNKNINEGLIGIIAARLKDYFNKPSIVITNSNNIFKGSGRSTQNYNLGHLMKKLLDKKIIEKGGGHNMAAGFTIKKDKVKILEDFILKDSSQINFNLDFPNNYDAQLSPSSINKNFFEEINKLSPFGNTNTLPIFLFKNLKIIKTIELNNKHISAILKPKTGSSIKSICFNCINNDIGKHLLNNKNEVNVIAQIQENIWNNKKTIQLNIKDILL